MFDSLDDDFKRDAASSSLRERWLRYAAVLVISVLAFGGLYFGVRFLE